MSITLSGATAALGTPVTRLVVGAIIRANTGGDKAKMVSRAQDLVNIANAFIKINTGDTSGLTDLAAAFTKSTMDPSESLALHDFLAWGAEKIAGLQKLGADTLLGQVDTAIFNNFQQTVIATAQAYISAYGTQATANAAATAPAQKLG